MSPPITSQWSLQSGLEKEHLQQWQVQQENHRQQRLAAQIERRRSRLDLERERNEIEKRMHRLEQQKAKRHLSLQRERINSLLEVKSCPKKPVQFVTQSVRTPSMRQSIQDETNSNTISNRTTTKTITPTKAAETTNTMTSTAAETSLTSPSSSSSGDDYGSNTKPPVFSCNPCCRKDRIIHRQRQEILALRQQILELTITVTPADTTNHNADGPPISLILPRTHKHIRNNHNDHHDHDDPDDDTASVVSEVTDHWP